MNQPAIGQRLAARAAFSYRTDGDVPAFADDKPVIVFDGVCVLCSAFARFVVKHDPQAQFRLATAQSVLGQGLFRHYGLDPQDFETNLLIDNGHAFGKLDAFVRIMTRLGGVNRLAVVTTVLPSGVGDFLYDRIAGNRYRLFGRIETCMLPPADWRERFLG